MPLSPQMTDFLIHAGFQVVDMAIAVRKSSHEEQDDPVLKQLEARRALLDKMLAQMPTPLSTKPVATSETAPALLKGGPARPPVQAGVSKEPWQMTREQLMASGLSKAVISQKPINKPPPGKYFHVVPADYASGDILSAADMSARGAKVANKWADTQPRYLSTSDAHKVSLFDNLAEAEEFRATTDTSFKIVEVNVPQGATIGRNAERYPAVRRVPGDWVGPEVSHKQAIIQALSEGKPVPPEVLKDYPDLAGAESAVAKVAPKAAVPTGPARAPQPSPPEAAITMRDYWDAHLEHNALRGQADSSAGAFTIYQVEAAGDIVREFGKATPDAGYISEKLRRIENSLNDVDWRSPLSRGDASKLTEVAKGIEALPAADAATLARKELLQAIASRNPVATRAALTKVKSAVPTGPARAPQPTAASTRTTVSATDTQTLKYQLEHIHDPLRQLELHLAEGCQIMPGVGCDCCGKHLRDLRTFAQETIPIAARQGHDPKVFADMVAWARRLGPITTIEASSSGKYRDLYLQESGTASNFRKKVESMTTECEPCKAAVQGKLPESLQARVMDLAQKVKTGDIALEDARMQLRETVEAGEGKRTTDEGTE